MISTDQFVEVKGSQSIVMMPRLQQAIHMLQLNNLDLYNFVTPIVEKNPFIREVSRHNGISEYDYNWVNNIEHKESVYEILDREIKLTASSSHELDIMLEILSVTDERIGVIQEKSSIIAERCGVTEDYIDAIIRKLQASGLPGFFSRNLKECLKLKMDRLGKLTRNASCLIDNIELAITKSIHALARKCSISVDEAITIIMDIGCTRPLSSFTDPDFNPQIIPDVFVTKNSDCSWKISMNQETLPKIFFDKDYEELVSAKCVDDRSKTFIKENVAEANWLVKSLEQRTWTILKVTKEIVSKQQMFFMYGPEFIEPMSLKDISSDLGIHESTVSRATAGKYIMTDFGVVDMKCFFTNAVNTKCNDSEHQISSSVIKRKIMKIIESEDQTNVYSDEDLVKELCDCGINISRRTVSKYRGSMNIPGYKVRKRMKLMTT